jgi:hydrogenase-4 component D
MQNLAYAIVLILFAGAAVSGLAGRAAAKWLAQAFALVALGAAVALTYVFAAAGKPALTVDLVSIGNAAVLGVVVDKISVLIALAVVGVGLVICVYSAAYLGPGNREHPDPGRRSYFAWLLAFIGSMAGLVFASTLVGELLFFEMTGVCSWALIGYYQDATSAQAAAKAMVLTHIGSLGLYVAAAALFATTGTFALSAIGSLGTGMKTIVLMAILFAAWGKSAQLPLQMWLPDAMVAPTPISAYLHAAAMVKVGVYIFARGLLAAGTVPQSVGWVGAVMAVVTMIYGFVMYLPQKDLKRLLAYSTITQLSYIFLALSLSVFGSQLAFNGAIAHIFNHAFAKSLFFLVAGALAYTTGTRMLPNLRGILTRSPLLGVAFCVAALAVTGVPPFNGFFSKFAIFSGGFAVARDHVLLLPLVLLAMLESVGSFAWFLHWVGSAVLGKPSPEVAAAAPVPVAMRVVLVVLVLMTLCSGEIGASWLGWTSP